jgi:hypothetical protein
MDSSFELYERSGAMSAAIFAETHADSLLDAAEKQRPNNSQHIIKIGFVGRSSIGTIRSCKTANLQGVGSPSP